MTTVQEPTDRRAWSGRAVDRKEDSRLLRAEGEFGDDTPVEHLAHLMFVRSPHAHARIVSIDVRGCEDVPGFLGALLPSEVEQLTEPFGETQPPPADAEEDRCLASGGKVRFVGDPVVAVVGDTREAARDAAAAVHVRYETLGLVLDPDQAFGEDAPLLHEAVGTNVLVHHTWDFGDFDAAAEEAAAVVEADELVFHRFSPTPLENNVVTATYDPGMDTFDFNGGIAMPGITLLTIAEALRHPATRIRVRSNDMGGSFGVKTVMYGPATAAALMARRLRRPVRWTETRTEHHWTGGHSNERTFRDVRLAVSGEGRILGLSYRCFDDIGAYSRYEPLGSVLWAQVANGCYAFDSLEVDFTSFYSNKGPTHSVRGYSRMQHMWVLERMVDLAVHRLGLDPVEFRMQNYVRPDQYPYTTVNGCVYDSGDLPTSLRKALDLIDYDDARALQARCAGTGKRIGIGIGSTLDSGTNNFGQSRLMNPAAGFAGNTEGALVRMAIDGKVWVTTGSVAFGQAHETTAAQVVADLLGMAYDDVFVHRGSDSALSAQTGFSGSYASQFAVTGIGAIIDATEKLAAEIRLVGADMLGAAADELVLADGGVRVRDDPERMLPLAAIAGTVFFAPATLAPEVADTVTLVGRGVYRAPFEVPDPETKMGNLTLTYATQIHACVVEIDEETGELTLLRYGAVDDCGTPINPMVIQGQVYGATAHGISAALFEGFRFDDQGQNLGANFYDYHAATAFDLPELRYDNVVSPSPFTPTGAKGMGEGGGAPLHAIAAAVQDAVGASGAVLHSHTSPEAILDALHGAGADRVRVVTR